MDRIAVADGIGKPLQRDEGRAFSRQQAVGVLMERPALSAGAQGFQSAESNVQKQIVAAADRTGQHEIGVAGLQLLASQLDCIER